MAGSFMSPVALAFGVLEITDSAAWLSAVTTAALIPMVATMLFGGGLADRYRRDTVLRLASLGAGPASRSSCSPISTRRCCCRYPPSTALSRA